MHMKDNSVDFYSKTSNTIDVGTVDQSTGMAMPLSPLTLSMGIYEPSSLITLSSASSLLSCSLQDNQWSGYPWDHPLIEWDTARESVAFAKAVKVDDAGVPFYLWNECITSAAASPWKDKALDCLCQLGLWHFWQNLWRDSWNWLTSSFGPHWALFTWRKDGLLTTMGQEIHAIQNALQYAMHSNWFKQDSSLRLHYFRFPQHYQKEACSGVRVYFLHPDLTSKHTQPCFGHEVTS